MDPFNRHGKSLNILVKLATKLALQELKHRKNNLRPLATFKKKYTLCDENSQR